MQITEETLKQDALIFSLYKEFKKTKTPENQRKLLERIDKALDQRSKITKEQREDDFASC